jgi:glycolate oxidase iron-sulfur subunit
MKRMTRWFLRSLLPRPGLMRMGASLLRIYQHLGMQSLARRTRLVRLLPASLRELESKLPRMSGRFFGPSRRTYRPDGEQPRLKVALLSGCVMPLMQAETMKATVRVLTGNGCEVSVPPRQGCCGALNLHAGDLELGRQMARRNIDAFRAAQVDVIVTASAGCGSAMKEYDDLLSTDPRYADAAAEFASRTRDITEFLADLPVTPPQAEYVCRVTMQDPCHLAHAQRITAAPRRVLQSIPGLELIEMEESSLCCGSAGFYSLIQREMSGRLQRRKVNNALATDAEIVASANPGCIAQLEQGLHNAGANLRVMHVVEILDAAYAADSGP